MIAAAAALVQVVIIDLALSADNAVAVGLAAATLPQEQRDRAIRWGIFVAFLLRVLFGLLALQLLQIHGILAVGGVILLWIAVRMWLDLRKAHRANDGPVHPAAPPPKHPSFARAIVSIVFANVAFSLDNVLAVAGVARHSFWIMVFGLALAILLMGVAATFIARIVDKNRWIGVVGVVFILIAGVVMIWEDSRYFDQIYHWGLNLPEPPAWLGGEQ